MAARPARKTAVRTAPAPRASKVAVAEPPGEPGPDEPLPGASARGPGPARVDPPASRLHEPVWLVRIVLVLFLVGFAAFLAREVRNFLSVLP